MTYRLDLGDERLWHGDQPVQISNKAFQLLRLFVSNRNRLLTKDDILEGVWGDVYVSEGLIKEYVHDLRLALGDDPKHPEFIETVRGRGYRFLGGVEGVKGAQATAAPADRKTAPPTLVVLPFTNLTGEERWSLFCRGLGDDLVTDLARYPDLMVVANGESSIDCADGSDDRGTGGMPGASYMLGGSVQASDTKVRVNVKLIESRHGDHVWTDQYDRELGDIFDIQSDIISHVASAVGGFSGQIPHVERQRLGRKPPSDLQAYELYLLGFQLEGEFEKQSALRGYELLTQAVELDPDFARAWLVLGWTCWQIVMEDWQDDTELYWAFSCEAFTRAAALDPLDPFALMESASVRAINDDIVGTSDALERALDLGRNQADLLIAASTYVATLLDDPLRAKQLLDKGLKILVRIPGWHQLTSARVSYFAKDFDGAVDHARRGPDNLPTRLFELMSLAQLGRRDEASELAGVFRAIYPKFDPKAFMRFHPITAEGAKRLFLEGVDMAGLN